MLDWVDTSYAQPLPLEALADRACFSPYHFHRIFKEYTGETPSNYVRRVRLQKAITKIEHGGRRSLSGVALECGFAQSSDFSRAFREEYGYPPSQHRKGRVAQDSKIRQDLRASAGYRELSPNEMEHDDRFEVRIEELPEQRMAYVRLIGEAYQPESLMAALNRLLAWGRERGIYPGATLVSTSPDNPEVVPAHQYRLDLGMVVPSGFSEDELMAYATLDRRRYAKVHSLGDIHKVQRAWTFLYHRWLPNSGYEPANAPNLELFLNSDDSKGWETLDLDCCLPIQSLSSSR